MTTIGVKVGIAGYGGSGTDPGGGGGDPGGGTTDPTPVNPLTVTLTSPDDQGTVAVSNPTFVVGVDTSSEDPTATYTLTLQYADNPAFTSAVTLTADFDATDAGAFLTPAGAVPAATYWRARVSQGSTWRSGWSDPQSFTVNNTVTPGSIPITWTVNDAAAPYIHLWHLVPAAAAPGDKVTAYGHGFGDTGKVLFASVPVAVTSWTLSAAPATSGDAGRVIDGDDVYPEHYEVVFTVPSYSGPGAALEVSP